MVGSYLSPKDSKRNTKNRPLSRFIANAPPHHPAGQTDHPTCSFNQLKCASCRRAKHSYSDHHKIVNTDGFVFSKPLNHISTPTYERHPDNYELFIYGKIR